MKTSEIQLSKWFEENYFLVSIIGLLSFFILSLSAFLTGTRFTGILEAHYVNELKISTAFLENFVITALLIIVLFFLSKFQNKETRLVSIINIVLLSRIPFVLLTFFNIGNYINLVLMINLSKLRNGLNEFLIGDVLFILLFTIVTIAVLIFSVYILYKGVKYEVGGYTKQRNLLFFLGLILTEFVSRAMISFMV